jgi:hypothetical protein
MDHIAPDGGYGCEVSQQEPGDISDCQHSHKSQVTDTDARRAIGQDIRSGVPGEPAGPVKIPTCKAYYSLTHIKKHTVQLV